MKPEEKMNSQMKYYRNAAHDFDFNRLKKSICHYRKIKLINNYLNIKPNEVVLEVGMGTGIHAKKLLEINADKNVRFVGCDLSSEMLGEARKRLSEFSNVRFIQSQAESLPLLDASMDKAYVSGSLHHFSNKRKAIEELIRVVKPGGIIAISEPNIFCPVNFILTLMNYKIESGQFYVHPKSLRRFFSNLPAEIMDQRFFNFTPPFPKSAERLFDKTDIFFGNMPILKYLGSMSLLIVKCL